MNEKPSEDSKPEKKTVANYAKKVFQESSVTAVSSICSTVNRPRKIFRSLVLLLCVTGFIYQCTTYLVVVFQYPTVVDVDIERPKFYSIPAITFCNNNGIQRSKFCSKYPRRCFLPDDEFCEKYAPYCGKTRNLVPKPEYYFIHDEMTLDDFKELGQNVSDFLSSIRPSNIYNLGLKGPEELEEPYFRIKIVPEYQKFVCYTWHSRVNNSNDVITYEKYYFANEPLLKMTFNVRQEDVFMPGTTPGVLFAIHSPYQAVNPIDKGIFLKNARSYKVSVEVEEEILQPDPYDTKCMNYTEVWLKNNKTGPRTQEMCQHKCILDSPMKTINCAYSESVYPTNVRPCTEQEELTMEEPESLKQEFVTCYNSCRDDCWKTKYYVDVQERFTKKFKVDREVEGRVEITDNSNKIFVDIYMDDDEIITRRHNPKYLTVEVFGIIGGFMGGWLGMSLIQFADLSESLFRIARYACKKLKRGGSYKPSNTYEM